MEDNHDPVIESQEKLIALYHRLVTDVYQTFLVRFEQYDYIIEKMCAQYGFTDGMVRSTC